jgi:glyoxylase-like metal-dependent hydrolase (beta-lactamase superfamily II)
MELYPGGNLIECEINRRPLYLPVLREGSESLLLDCGTRSHALQDVPAALDRLGVSPEDLTWLVITHPDGDHCGGMAEIKKRYPNVRLACGEMDRSLVESPEYLFSARYDAYRQDHGVFFDERSAQEIRDCSSEPQTVSCTFTGGEVLRLGENRILQVWHLPGHSHGHLGLFDCRSGVLYYGDAIQGSGYRGLDGSWTLCPTYLYVDAYLQTIHNIECSEARMIVGCHWPILQDAESIAQFCLESREFVVHADHLITEYLRQHSSGASLRELCEQLSERLGSWPTDVHLELANAFSGHLNRGVESGRFEVDRTRKPFLYRSRESRHFS